MKTLIIFMLATGAFGAPFYSGRPRNSCSKRTVRFPSGKKLYYNYVGETVTSVNGPSTAQSGLKIKARCVIKTVGACQHVLKIDSVELWEGQSKNLSVAIEYRLSRENAVFAWELRAHDLVFRSRNGAIVEVLSSYDETPQNLNIKKGILSALQVQIIKNDFLVNETDIAGKCPVQYRIHSKHLNGRVKVLSRTRNVKECSDRSKTYFGIHFHQKNEKSFDTCFSSSNCRYLLNAKIRVSKVKCQEKLIYRPFSSVPALATTTTKQILEYQGAWRIPFELGYDVSRFPRSSPLTFEHVKPQPKSLDYNKVIEIIKELARQSIEETKPESARLFSHLISHLRKLYSIAVEKVWDAIFDCERLGSCTPQEEDKFQAYLLDALPYCGTSGCALVMTRAIERRLVNGERGNMFLAGIQMFDPKEDVIAHILELCQTKPSVTNMLTLATLIRKYCEDGKCNRLSLHSSIVKAENWLLSLLGRRCDFENSEQAEKIIMALKAISNADRLKYEYVQLTLLKCATNRHLPTNMTIAVLETLRRMPCNPAIRRNITIDLHSRGPNISYPLVISGVWFAIDVNCTCDGYRKDMLEKEITRTNASGLLAVLKIVMAFRDNAFKEVKTHFGVKMMLDMTIQLRKEKVPKKVFDEIKELPSPLSEFISYGPDFHKQTNWPISDKNSSSVSLIDFVVKMAVAGNTDKTFTKSMLFLDVEAAIPTILGLPLKHEAKGTAVVSATENKDPVIFFGPVTFNYLGNRKISAVVEVASRMGVDLDYAGIKGIISRNTLYTPSQSGTMEVLNTGL